MEGQDTPRGRHIESNRSGVQVIPRFAVQMCVPLLPSGSEPSRATGTIFIFREAAYRKVLRVSRSVMRKYYACVLTVFTAVLGARVGGLYRLPPFSVYNSRQLYVLFSWLASARK